MRLATDFSIVPYLRAKVLYFKKELSDIGRNAREVSRILDRLRSRGNLSEGIKIFEDRDESQNKRYL